VSHVEERLAARERGREKGRLYRSYMHSSVSGLEVGVGIAVGALIGLWCDRRFGISPWGVLGGTVVGMIHAARVLYSLYLKSQREDAAESKDDEADRPHGEG